LGEVESQVPYGDQRKDLRRHTGAISDCETAVEYLEKVESQITGSSKAYVSSLIKRLVSEKYTGGGV
jgi:hypothetical protein